VNRNALNRVACSPPSVIPEYDKIEPAAGGKWSYFERSSISTGTVCPSNSNEEIILQLARVAMHVLRQEIFSLKRFNVVNVDLLA
jgi:hypothetical protein